MSIKISGIFVLVFIISSIGLSQEDYFERQEDKLIQLEQWENFNAYPVQDVMWNEKT